ncbi:hypothetical protein RGQ13_12870 [Thalassotalea psychrophila]|uniref:Lipoprotein n=1 Tax=Thalassotalea psychrophila TaxID=3065647 RepID=A0ABY9TQD2_9GAMM|nr:hypothetical protein RGQ13_12870 [Colwelliaceae bacterium SQ149]
MAFFTTKKIINIMFITTLAACSSNEGPPPIPDCDYSAHSKLNDSINQFIWADSSHTTFTSEWQHVAVEQVTKKYGYLQRKSLPDAQNAEKGFMNFQRQVENLLITNKDIQVGISTKQCVVGENGETSDKLEVQNASVEYVLAALPKILKSIQTKKNEIIETLEKR